MELGPKDTVSSHSFVRVCARGLFCLYISVYLRARARACTRVCVRVRTRVLYECICAFLYMSANAAMYHCMSYDNVHSYVCMCTFADSHVCVTDSGAYALVV